MPNSPIMTTVRPFEAQDLFAFNNVNMDHWTETYSNGFYLNYLGQWPDMTLTACAAHSGRMMGYVLGKAEGRAAPARASADEMSLHGHVTAVTVAPEYRRLGVAQMLMDFFEIGSEHAYAAYFVDLFVRPSNTKAIGMYEKRGYSIYRRVHAYYRSNGTVEDGYGRSRDSPRHAQAVATRYAAPDGAEERAERGGAAGSDAVPAIGASRCIDAIGGAGTGAQGTAKVLRVSAAHAPPR